MPWHDIIARAWQGSFDSALARSRLAQDDILKSIAAITQGRAPSLRSGCKHKDYQV